VREVQASCKWTAAGSEVKKQHHLPLPLPLPLPP
jgi:hypothetical protein